MNQFKVYVLCFFISTTLEAGTIEFIGSSPVKISTTTNVKGMQIKPFAKPKVILVQKFKLDDDAKLELKERLKNISTNNQQINFIVKKPVPKLIDLKMNNVPVLDQGPYGSYVTFAISGVR